MPVSSSRPLSPHLQIYKPQLTSVLSILHRITGVFLSAGALVLTLLIYSTAFHPVLFEDIRTSLLQYPLGIIITTIWIFAFYYHFANGIRHLFWDVGKGFSLGSVYKSGTAVVLISLSVTILTLWCLHG
ncbi:MAG: succinate dehydrogenase, cytochrome b556 subunit [Holosporales bacterium]|jgi:succinate dehydrogenase / fumarate reductase cytochrome b subunit